MLGDCGPCGGWVVVWSGRDWSRRAGEQSRSWAMDLASRSAFDASEPCGLGEA